MGKRKKKIPMRKCVGCNEVKEKRKLIRVVRTPEKEVLIDRTGKKSGRGAYICPSVECLEAAVKAKRLEKSLNVKIDDELIQRLREEVEKDEQGE